MVFAHANLLAYSYFTKKIHFTSLKKYIYIIRKGLLVHEYKTGKECVFYKYIFSHSVHEQVR